MGNVIGPSDKLKPHRLAVRRRQSAFLDLIVDTLEEVDTTDIEDVLGEEVQEVFGLVKNAKGLVDDYRYARDDQLQQGFQKVKNAESVRNVRFPPSMRENEKYAAVLYVITLYPNFSFNHR